MMQQGIIETIRAEEADERKEFWNARLLDLGLEGLYEANAHWVNVPNRRLCIFIEKKRILGNGTSEKHLSPLPRLQGSRDRMV
jgi:hypothetical protein